MKQLDLDLDVREIESLGPDYDEDGKTWEYKKYRDFYDLNQITTEVAEDKSYLKWYENWKKENFNYKEKKQ
jgi:hypothetical protein